MYALVVFTADEVQLLTACASREAAMRELARYVRERAAYKLHGGERRRVHQLLDDNRDREAVDLYFSLIGVRWDREHWTMRHVPGAGEPREEDSAPPALLTEYFQ